MVRVLFLCLGNICRSPMAEGIFRHLVEEQGLSEEIKCDSAGTGAYHIGELPDRRARTTAQAHGLTLTHKARQLHESDFTDFDYIVAMDHSNYTVAFEKTAKLKTAKIVMARTFDPRFQYSANIPDVPDPYYSTAAEYERVYFMLDTALKGFLTFIINNHFHQKLG